MSSASGGLRPPDPLTRGVAPGPHWGLCPQTPLWARATALAIPPHQKFLDPPLFVINRKVSISKSRCLSRDCRVLTCLLSMQRTRVQLRVLELECNSSNSSSQSLRKNGALGLELRCRLQEWLAISNATIFRSFALQNFLYVIEICLSVCLSRS